MLTVADIRRWDPDAVRAVFHAAIDRAQITATVSREIGALQVFATWGGAAAQAAQHANALLRQDLDAHGVEAVVVAHAASRAADGIEHVQHELSALEIYARDRNLMIDPINDRLVPAGGAEDYTVDMSTAQRQLQPFLAKILDTANAINHQLAAAIDMADGDRPVPPGLHDNRPAVQQVLYAGLPDDPDELHDVWVMLTPAEKDWFYRRDPTIGNRPGVDFADKNHYNRRHLNELTSAAAAERARLAAEHPDWAAHPPILGQDHSAPPGWPAWSQRWAEINRTVDAYTAVQQGLSAQDGAPRFLAMIDAQGHAAITIGDPDHAKRTAVFIPGTGQDLRRWQFSDHKSTAMYRAALSADPRLRPQDLSVTTWMGYDRPMSLWEAARPDSAHSGAVALDRFEQGLRASHVGPRSLNTVIGHSYGSVVIGDAASAGHHLDVDKVVAVGSPGMLVDRAAQLDLDPGAAVYAMEARNDIVRWGAGGLGLGSCPPDDPRFGAIRLAADPGPSFAGVFPTVDAHSSYWDDDNIALANLGAVIAGVRPPALA